MLCKFWCLQAVAKRNSLLSSPPRSHPSSMPELSFGASHSLLFSNPNAASPSAPSGCSWQPPQLPSSPPSLLAFLTQVCVGTSLLCSLLNIPSWREKDRESAYWQECSPPWFHLSMYNQGKSQFNELVNWLTTAAVEERHCLTREHHESTGSARPRCPMLGRTRVRPHGRDHGPKNWVGFADLPLSSTELLYLTSLWGSCLACLNGKKMKENPREKITRNWD